MYFTILLGTFDSSAACLAPAKQSRNGSSFKKAYSETAPEGKNPPRCSSKKVSPQRIGGYSTHHAMNCLRSKMVCRGCTEDQRDVRVRDLVPASDTDLQRRGRRGRGLKL